MNRDFQPMQPQPALRQEIREIAAAPEVPGPDWLAITAQTAGSVLATIALFAAFAWFAQRSRRRPLDPSHPAWG